MSQLPPPDPHCWIALDDLDQWTATRTAAIAGARLTATVTRAHLYPVGRTNIHHHEYSPALAELERLGVQIITDPTLPPGTAYMIPAKFLTDAANRATVPSHAATTHREMTGDPVTPPPTT